MDKQYLVNIAKARKSISIWFSNLEQINEDVELLSDQSDFDLNTTDFGIWYLDEGQIFSSFESFKDVESQYNLVNDLYIEFNKLYQTPVKKRLFSRKIEKRKEELSTILEQIEIQKNYLCDCMTFFEENVKNSPLFTAKDQTDDILPVDVEAVEEVSKVVPEEKFKNHTDSNLKMDENDWIKKSTNVTKVTKKIPDLNKDFLEFDIEKEIHKILNSPNIQ